MTRFSVLVSVVVASLAMNAKAMSCDVKYQNLPTKIEELEAQRDELRARAMGEGLMGGVAGGSALSAAAMGLGSFVVRVAYLPAGIAATVVLWWDASEKKAHYKQLEVDIAALRDTEAVYSLYLDARETLSKRGNSDGQKEEKEKYSEDLEKIATKVSTSLKERYFVPNQIVGFMESGELCEETSPNEWQIDNRKQLTQLLKSQIKYEAKADKEQERLAKDQISMR
jgi:uncharacterized protein (UPF0297 family)